MTEDDKAFGGGEGGDQPEAGDTGEHAGGLERGEEGSAKAQATEKISDEDQVKGQTQAPAPEGDAGGTVGGGETSSG